MTRDLRRGLPKAPDKYTQTEQLQAQALVDRAAVKHKGRTIQVPDNPSEAVQALADGFKKTFESVEKMVQYNQFLDYYHGRTPYTKFRADAIAKKGEEWLIDLVNLQAVDPKAAEKMLTETNVGLISRGYFTHPVVKPGTTKKIPQRIDSVGGRVLSRAEIEKSVEVARSPFDVISNHVKRVIFRYYLQPHLHDLDQLYGMTMEVFGDKGAKKVQNYLNRFSVRSSQKELPGAGARALRTMVGGMLNARLMLPDKWIRNLLQNIAYDPKLSSYLKVIRLFNRQQPIDREFFATHVSNKENIKRDQLFQETNAFTKVTGKANLYPYTDEVNRLANWVVHLPTAKALAAKFANGKLSARKFYDRSLTWLLYPRDQQRVFEILAQDGPDAAARFLTGSLCDKLHFNYARFKRSPVEQSELGEIFFNLFTYTKGVLRRTGLPIKAIKDASTFGAKARAVLDLPHLIVMMGIAGWLYRKLTGREEDPYSLGTVIEAGRRGGAYTSLPKAEVDRAFRFQQALMKGDIEEAAHLVDGAGRTFLPFYENIARITEAAMGEAYIGPLEALVRSPQAKKVFVDRSGLEAASHSILGGYNDPEPKRPKSVNRTLKRRTLVRRAQ